MTNILLCGNGINIEFNQDFCFKKFLDILVNEKELENLVNEILLKPEYQTFVTIKQELLEIFEKCKDSILALDENARANGVEVAVLNFKNSVRVLMSQFPANLKRDIFIQFEELFDLLFFYYLDKLERKNIISLTKNPRWNSNLRNYLKRYQYIYTLNYDGLLTKIYKEKYIHYVHGRLKTENNKLNYSDCVFESYLTPKCMISRKTNLPIFLGMRDLKNEFCLDIVGLNPKNDEDIFTFFILSKVCHEINYYYHPSTSNSDLKNITEFIEIIKSWNRNYQGITLNRTKDFVEIKFNEENYETAKRKIEVIKNQDKLFYVFKFWKFKRGWILDHLLQINLKKSKDFWNEVNKNQLSIKNLIIKNSNEIITK